MSKRHKCDCFVTPDGRTFAAREQSETHDKLPPGLYRYDMDMSGMVYFQQEIQETSVIPDTEQAAILSEVDTFWKAAPEYAKIGFPHKRGILLYGPPGTGKSTLIKMVVKDVMNRGGIAFELCHAGEFHAALQSFRDVCPETPVVVTIEDLDRYMHGHEEVLLNVLDGSCAISHVLFIASTNNKDGCSERLTRPSRFDTPKKIGFPNIDARRRLIAGLIPGVPKKDLEELTKQSAEKSVAEIKELILQRYIYSARQGQPTK